MKRIWLENSDYIDIESLGRDHGIRIRLADKMGYAKEYKYFTDAEILNAFGYDEKVKKEATNTTEQKENNKELKCVWVLTHSWADRFGNDADEPKAFVQEETAKRVFNELVNGHKEEKPLFDGVYLQDIVVEEDESEDVLDFYAYVEGCADTHNIHVNLRRCIIED